ncbi:MAG: CpaF family protein [Microthrixaceae bacterium]
MSLYQRINEQQGGQPPQPGPGGGAPQPPRTPGAGGPGAPGGPAAPPGGAGGGPGTPPRPPAGSGGAGGSAGMAQRRDPMVADLRHRIHQQLIDELGPILFDRRLTEDDLRRRVHEQLHAAIAAERVPLSAADKAQLIQDVSDDILGYGPIDKLLRDEDVTEVMVNGPDQIFVERGGKLTHDREVRFIDTDHVRRVIDKIVSEVGRRIDESTPMVDARLPDGSRVNAVISPLAIGGPFLTIRKFAADPLRIDDLIRFGSINPHAARFMQACIVGKLNVIVSGGTGTGKTTMLNVLSGFIPEDERIITVEDAKELQLHQEHVLSMESRPPNVEGRGEVTIRDLVKNTLRMRPDRIVVGECRSGEALDMLQAMNTGHDGSLTTVHANSPRDTLARLETLVLMAGFDLPVRAIREQMASAIDVIVQLSRLRDGTRRVTHVTEVQGMEGDVITLQDIFLFDFAAGVDENGRYRGQLRATGVRPKFAEKLADQGIRLGPEVFSPDGERRAVTR